MSGLPYVEHVYVGSIGRHVDAYRRMLARWSATEGFEEVAEGGAFGTGSAARVRLFQQVWSERHPGQGVRPTGAIGPATHAGLAQWADAEAISLLRLEHEARHPCVTARQLVVTAALGALARRGELVYSGRSRATVGRRWHGIEEELAPPDVPLFADCSSLATWCLWVARDHGARDPSRRDWRPGSTATMESNGCQVAVASALPGALFFYANPQAGRHVAIMVERVRGIAFVVSFGGEGGPSYLRWDYRRTLFGSDEVTSVRDYINA